MGACLWRLFVCVSFCFAWLLIFLVCLVFLACLLINDVLLLLQEFLQLILGIKGRVSAGGKRLCNLLSNLEGFVRVLKLYNNITRFYDRTCLFTKF